MWVCRMRTLRPSALPSSGIFHSTVQGAGSVAGGARLGDSAENGGHAGTSYHPIHPHVSSCLLWCISKDREARRVAAQARLARRRQQREAQKQRHRQRHAMTIGDRQLPVGSGVRSARGLRDAALHRGHSEAPQEDGTSLSLTSLKKRWAYEVLEGKTRPTCVVAVLCRWGGRVRVVGERVCERRGQQRGRRPTTGTHPSNCPCSPMCWFRGACAQEDGIGW